MKLQRVKGMYDIVPDATPLWQMVERAAITLLQDYGYGEIRLPLLERTEVFARAIGQGTDVVSKEMYSFDDRNGESLTLRPEGTAGCVRAALQNGLLKSNAVKLWYAGPMFRHENVQRGRNRQFYQVGGEAFGLSGPDIDAELIALLARLWRQLGLKGVQLEINSLGTVPSRTAHREALLKYLRQREDELDEDSQRRLDTNPLRILDSKNPQMASLIAGAPSLLDYLDDESQVHFERLQSLLEAFGVQFDINPLLVRGLDYYSRTVFEFKTEDLGSQGTICAGGRYDTLVETLGGKPTPAVGFSLGVDRVVELLEVQGARQDPVAPHVYVVAVGGEAEFRALQVAESLRSAVPGLRITSNLGGGSFKAQFKRADRSGARYALVFGEAELAENRVQIKPLRRDEEQASVALAQLPDQLRKLCADIEKPQSD